MSPSILDSLLSRLPRQNDPAVLVGFDTADDAGVYRLPPELAPDLALVQTVDFFTPIVDDPLDFGRIAAANSLSDIYAMGGRPMTALSIVGFPNSGADPGVLEKILLGGLEKMREAGCTVLGGHSIADEEIKFGYAVTGLIRPEGVLSNASARPGDRLVLTKRIGTGVIGTALKKNAASEESVRSAVESMTMLNREASEAALARHANSVTDITGFGFIGHLREMAAGSKVSVILESEQIDLLPGALEYAARGFLPGGLARNVEFVSSCVEFAPGVPEPLRNLLFDPQTSGGLLISIASGDAGSLIRDLAGRGIPAKAVGEVIEKRSPLISVR